MAGKNDDQQAGGTDFLPGEEVVGGLESRAVTYMCSLIGPVPGVLSLTNYRFTFRSNKGDDHSNIEIPLCTIYRIEKVGGVTSKGENSYGIDIHCKDLRTLRFAHKQENHSRRDVFEKLQTYAFPVTNKLPLFAIVHRAAGAQYTVNGWNIYEPKAEYKRLGIGVNAEGWKIKNNENFSLCDTYPSVFVVPSAADDNLLSAVAKYRSRGRFPVLSWLHPITQASITRCSQPLTSVSGKRCQQDESYIEMILDANAQNVRIAIIDARPITNAYANKARGGGFENQEHYKNVDLLFLDIDNIHAMRESLRKLKEFSFPGIDENRWFSNIESTHWLEHIRTILSGVFSIVEKIESTRTSVVVHCSDGWDRTSQLTSLSMLSLDSFYRTIVGFEILIEKEWVSFGHKFAQRIGHGDDKYQDGDRSPVFLQFIDCVWQLTQKYKNAFEFNEKFLITILDHLYSCRFGTFLCNSELERQQENIKNTTHSLWSFINSNLCEYLNPSYSTRTQREVLMFSPSIRQIILWKDYYCRWNPMNQRDKRLFNDKQKELNVIRNNVDKRCEELMLQVVNMYSRSGKSSTMLATGAASGGQNTSGKSEANINSGGAPTASGNGARYTSVVNL